MTDYSKLSDFEINCAVGEIVLHGCWESKPGTGGNDSDSWNYGSQDRFTPYPSLPDYCNSWADTGPIMAEDCISLSANETSEGEIKWLALSPESSAYKQVWHKNPCRAICIVFLMMNEGE